MPSRSALKIPAKVRARPRTSQLEKFKPRDRQSEINKLIHDNLLLTQMNEKLMAANEQLRREVAGLGQLLSQPVSFTGVSNDQPVKPKSLGKKIEREVRRLRDQLLGRKKK